ncbi:MAG: DUF502 domain-containing protein [Phycisphaerae bacterium]|nr:DUF502 domain-containing protein [Phycisphaerae bacterium]MDD5381147.1 DUF502 domain-containing protein [Phycisphaerae bacterium]
MKKLLGYFLKGLLVFLPVTATAFVFVWAFTSIDALLRNILRIKIPGAGLAATIVLITIIGVLTSNVIGRKLFEWLDKVLKKVPIVRLLYNSIKDLVEAFAGDKKKFDKPVLATIANTNMKVVGFVTKEELANLGLNDYAAVYLPQSYNWAGNVVLLPKQAIQPLNIDSAEVMAFIVSGGVSGQGQDSKPATH